jgi:hypothetical protein
MRYKVLGDIILLICFAWILLYIWVQLEEVESSRFGCDLAGWTILLGVYYISAVG